MHKGFSGVAHLYSQQLSIKAYAWLELKDGFLDEYYIWLWLLAKLN
jgi:hypothetical protein